MKLSLGILLCFGQIICGYSSRPIVFPNAPKGERLEYANVIAYSHQVTDFEININTPGHEIFITDNKDSVLYSQRTSTGQFQITTSDTHKNINIYDKAGSQYIAPNLNFNSHNSPPDVYYNDFVEFGHNDAVVKVKAILTSIKADTTNKHFVRFMIDGVSIVENMNFSVSIEKILSPNLRTEPSVGIWDFIEDNTIVSNDIYLKFKNYVLSQHLNNDPKRPYSMLNIDIDYKHRYCLTSAQALRFLTSLLEYLQQEKMPPDCILNIKKMIPIAQEDADFDVKYKDQPPPDPN